MFKDLPGLQVLKWLAGALIGILIAGWIYLFLAPGYSTVYIFLEEELPLLLGVLLICLLGVQFAFRPFENYITRLDNLNFYLQRVQRLGKNLQKYETEEELLKSLREIISRELPYSNTYLYRLDQEELVPAENNDKQLPTISNASFSEKVLEFRCRFWPECSYFETSSPVLSVQLLEPASGGYLLFLVVGSEPERHSFHRVLAHQLSDQASFALRQLELLEREKTIQQELDREVKKKTRELSQQEQFLNSIISSLDAGLLLKESGDNYRLVNRQAAALLNLRDVDEFPAPLENPEEYLPAELLEDRIEQESNMIKFEERYLEYIWQPVNKVDRLMLLRDRTERIKMQQKVEFNRSLSMLGDMVASVTHELKNPLGGMKLYVNMLEREIDKESKSFELIKKLVNGLETLQENVDGLLDFARTGKPEFEPLDPNQLISNVRNYMSERLQEADVEVSDRLPDYSQIYGDSEQLESVLVNLIQNAIDAQEKNPRIDLLGSETEDYIEISVQDYGVGIEAEETERVFDLFESSKKSGTGLGLTISRRVVDIHGGSINVESTPEEGSKFTVRLPRRPEVLEKEETKYDQ